MSTTTRESDTHQQTDKNTNNGRTYRKLLFLSVILFTSGMLLVSTAEAFSRGLTQKIRYLEERAKLKKHETAVAKCEEIQGKHKHTKAVQCAETLLKQDLAIAHRNRLNTILNPPPN